MRSYSYGKRMHGSYFLAILIAAAIVAIVFAGLFFFQVFKPIQTSADSGESLGRSSESQSLDVSLLPHNWRGGDVVNEESQKHSTLKLTSGEEASTVAVTQFFVNHPGASFKLCVRASALDKNGSLSVSSPSLSGATINLSDKAFRTVCVKQTVSSMVGTSESPTNWNVVQIRANNSTLLIRSVSLAST